MGRGRGREWCEGEGSSVKGDGEWSDMQRGRCLSLSVCCVKLLSTLACLVCVQCM